MNIREILTEQEISDVILKVARNHKGRKFGSFTENDIIQQACLIATQKLDEFVLCRKKVQKPKQALENWLNKVVSNRLRNFFRDNVGIHYKEYKSDKSEFTRQQRINLLNPIDISVTNDKNLRNNPALSFESIDLLHYITKRLDEDYIEILDCLLSGENISSYYRSKLMDQVKKILRDIK